MVLLFLLLVPVTLQIVARYTGLIPRDIQEVLSLPVHPWLTDDEIDRVAATQAPAKMP